MWLGRLGGFAAAWGVIAVVAAGATWLACGAKRPSGPALAEVHDEVLRQKMSGLEQVLLSDLGDAARGPTVRQDLVRVARDLQAIAARLPDAVATLDLDPEQKSHFITFADGLAGSAGRLEQAAPTAPSAVVQQRIDEVTQTCAGCHWAFRVDPAP
jgi:cytochrome c556